VINNKLKVVIDTNVAIDALKSRQPFDTEAKAIFRAFGMEQFEPYITANSLTDIFYVLRRGNEANTIKAKTVIANLMSVVTVVSLTESDCTEALELPMNDFEDAVVAVCAKKIGADCIVSRDVEFINSNTSVEVISPAQLLLKLK
jgi:predicted nucleic acid-binding protein